ncbi:MAG: helix-turn-helix transcriptional regulator [Lachnospiraceae bacterium]|nr:helix-turn-helix transcriptional regulator [Lachnospiraceae bacterium]
MDIKTAFLSSLISPPKLSSPYHAEDFLGNIFDFPLSSDFPLFQILAGGNIKALFPYSFDIRSLDCYALLYTRKGCGKLLVDNHVHTLMESSLLFFDCHTHFRIDVAIEPWEYQVLFITGKNLGDYYSMIPPEQTAIMPLSAYSETALCLDKLVLTHLPDTLSGRLSTSSLIYKVITDCITYQLSEPAPSHTASYLTAMKDLFDNHFEENYSLDDLEALYHISKYKLCREFGAAFGLSPLKYLNQKRIEIAKHLLKTTSLKVHEIGSRVGIDNTNHFISLFKKFTGVTPLEFRSKGHSL